MHFTCLSQLYIHPEFPGNDFESQFEADEGVAYFQGIINYYTQLLIIINYTEKVSYNHALFLRLVAKE